MGLDMQMTSTRPYLIRALHDWCTDNGFTPYVTVVVDGSVQVPREYVKDGEIVLNIGFEATTGLTLGNDYIEFKARFAGVARDIMVPVNQVVAIFAKENGQGMAFPGVEPPVQQTKALKSEKPTKAPVARLSPVQGRTVEESGSAAEPPKPATRPSLTRIK